MKRLPSKRGDRLRVTFKRGAESVSCISIPEPYGAILFEESCDRDEIYVKKQTAEKKKQRISQPLSLHTWSVAFFMFLLGEKPRHREGRGKEKREVMDRLRSSESLVSYTRDTYPSAKNEERQMDIH